MNSRSIFLNPDIATWAQDHVLQYQKNNPFPHIVIDNFFSPDTLNQILQEFPNVEDPRWVQFKNAREKKLATSANPNLPQTIQSFLNELNSPFFLNFLEKLTGIEGIIPDPYLDGGGMHQIIKGGHLKIHADFNKHGKLRLDRRLNLLLYLNQNWKEEYGGHLELWDTSMKKCEQRILPVFNRCVIFSTTSFSYHGHPDPLTCPDGWSRKSLALYYYTNGRPNHELVAKRHATLFQKRPGEDWQETKKKFSLRPKRWLTNLFPQLFVK